MPALPAFAICAFVTDETLIEQLRAALDSDRYNLTACNSHRELIDTLASEWSHFDCLVLNLHDSLPALTRDLRQAELLMPTAILSASGDAPSEGTGATGETSKPTAAESASQSVPSPTSHYYHQAEVRHNLDSPTKSLDACLAQAVSDFLNLSPSERSDSLRLQPTNKAALLLEEKQWILTEKLKERLGYLGVYYKRNPQRFLRNLASNDAIELIEQLQILYRDIVLSYFDNSVQANSRIDEFVYQAFFADISVTRVVEIHMNLMDEFSKQLQLEGRSEEILLDYRLTLIDVIAHLCEIYRRSIPRDPKS